MKAFFYPAAMLLLTLTSLFAQATDGILVGTVLDPFGAAVPGAAVWATNTSTGVKTTAATNSSGQYRLSNLPGGVY